MKGDIRCIEGWLYRHDPQSDDPDYEISRGACPRCRGKGCEIDTGWQAPVVAAPAAARFTEGIRGLLP